MLWLKTVSVSLDQADISYLPPNHPVYLYVVIQAPARYEALFQLENEHEAAPSIHLNDFHPAHYSFDVL